MIFIDKEGCWYHEGAEMIHREFIRLFYQHLRLDSEGRYIIDWNGKPCHVEVEDTAFVVRTARFLEKEPDGKTECSLNLSDDSEEPLEPATLYVGKQNVLYCRVKNNTFPARFTRSAYYQLAHHIEEENGLFYLPLQGKRHVILIKKGAKP